MMRIIKPCIYFPSKSVCNSIYSQIATITANLVSFTFIKYKTYTIGNSSISVATCNLAKINCTINLKIVSNINRTIKRNISRLKRTICYSLDTSELIIIILCTSILIKKVFEIISINRYFTSTWIN